VKNQFWNFFNSILKVAALIMSVLAVAFGQDNPVPQIVGPVHPSAVAPGSGAFTLHVYGANFVPASVVNWNYQPRVTSYVSGHEIQAQILAADVETNAAGYITVTNPAPGGGSSSASWAQVEVHDPIDAITVPQPAYYDFGYWQLQAADFNHDGILDLVGEHFRGLGLALGTGDGSFAPASEVDPTNLSPTQFGYGDFNGDGNLDLVSFSYLGAYLGLAPIQMNVLLGDGKGGFTRGPGLYSKLYDFYYVTVGDFDQDGKLDLVTRSLGGYLSTYLGNGDGTFRAVAHNANPSSVSTLGVLSGDFNNDGKLDILLMQAVENNKDNLVFWFLAGNGDGTFQKATRTIAQKGTFFCGFQVPFQLGDFNGDGNLDLAFCTDTQVGVMLGNGDGTFQPPNYCDAGVSRDFSFTIGDINSDGKPDIIVSQYLNSAFAVCLGNGDGTFQPAQTLATGGPNGETGMLTGDFRSDGLLDTILLNDAGMNVFLQ
jgi:hypothetical protein